jgi:endonuclease IV
MVSARANAATTNTEKYVIHHSWLANLNSPNANIPKKGRNVGG